MQRQSFVVKVQGEVITFSLNRRKMPQQYAELPVWPARANYL
jgi:hypothetical protein